MHDDDEVRADEAPATHPDAPVLDVSDADTDAATDTDADDDASMGSSRGWRIAAVLAVIAAAASMGVLGSLLFFGDDDGEGAGGGDRRACFIDRDRTDGDQSEECPPKGADETFGLVQKSDAGGFTMRPVEGSKLGDEIRLYVREADRTYIDVAHAQTHAALGQPVCVYSEPIDGRESVVYMTDVCGAKHT